MTHQSHSQLVSFIWRIADDCLRDVYVRGKYRDVILPMVVLRRLDSLLEPTKEAVLEEMRYQRQEMQSLELDDDPLRAASGYLFYNTGIAAQIFDNADFGYYCQPYGCYLTYEPCGDLRDSESVPLKDTIHRYFRAEVQPHLPEAWINLESIKIGYEISFNKYFYRHKPLRTLQAVTHDILTLEKQAEGLVAEILNTEITP